MKILMLSILGIVFSGCSLTTPHLFGNESCKNKNKAAYVYANGNAAVCLSEKSVAYIICARELGMSSQTNNQNKSISLDVTASGKVLGLGIFGEDNKTKKTIYESIGVLAKARAKAINTCVEMYETYPTF